MRTRYTIHDARTSRTRHTTVARLRAFNMQEPHVSSSKAFLGDGSDVDAAPRHCLFNVDTVTTPACRVRCACGRGAVGVTVCGHTRGPNACIACDIYAVKLTMRPHAGQSGAQAQALWKVGVVHPFPSLEKENRKTRTRYDATRAQY